MAKSLMEKGSPHLFEKRPLQNGDFLRGKAVLELFDKFASATATSTTTATTPSTN